MPRKIEFTQDSNLGDGAFVVVLADGVPVGRIAKNWRGEWCYFGGADEQHPEIVNRDLDAIQVAVLALLR